MLFKNHLKYTIIKLNSFTMGNFSYEEISSFRNSKIKNFAFLQKAKERKKQNLFVLEGNKELEKAMQKAYSFKALFFCKEIANASFLESLLSNISSDCEVYRVTKEIYSKIAYRESTEGIVAWLEPKHHCLEMLNLTENPLLIVLDAIEKPGNLGAILRTAEAAGVDALLLSDPATDIYNPNVIRSSLGCVFTVPIAIGSAKNVLDFLKEKKISVFCTALSASKPYHQINFKLPSALVMGTEATGLSPVWLENSSQNIIIPMKGIVDSMNVSVSTAIVVYEALRQRGF